MVLGLRSKSRARKGNLVEVDYLVHLQDIKPWPPSESTKSIKALLIQWETGDRNSGFVTCVVGDGNVECSEIFRLPVTLKREVSKKGTSSDGFRKNFLEFTIYESRRDNSTKGQQIGSACINLADYGIIKDSITISCPISLKRSSKSASQSVLLVGIQAYERDNSSLSKEGSVDKDGGSGSVSEVTNEGNDDGNEIVSFTDDDIDDDVSSHSSQNLTSVFSEANRDSATQADKNASGSTNGGVSKLNGMPTVSSGSTSSSIEANVAAVTHERSNRERQTNAAPDKSIQASSNSAEGTVSNLHGGSMEGRDHNDKLENGGNGDLSKVQKHTFQERLSDSIPQVNAASKTRLRSNTLAMNRTSAGVPGGTRKDKLKHLKSVQINYDSSEIDESLSSIDVYEKARKTDGSAYVNSQAKRVAVKPGDAKPETLSSKVESQSELEILEETYNNSTAAAEIGPPSAVSSSNFRNIVQLSDKAKTRNDMDTYAEPDGSQVMSRSKTKGTSKESEVKKSKTKGVSEESKAKKSNTEGVFEESEVIKRKTEGISGGSEVNWQKRAEMLEEELMEVAAVEVGLYSIVAEHGSSMNKVHAPARRLYRFYLHACKSNSESKKANAAKAIISGLVLVSKACGNDVPRLTFWLSNTILLRAITSQSIEKRQVSVQPSISINGYRKSQHPPTLCKNDKAPEAKGVGALEEPQTYIAALENVEAWIFSRIVESIWWLTLTPHMQCTAVNRLSSKKSHKRPGLGGQEQGNMAIDLWKKAFRDSCERLCPCRAGGHECGCLPLLPRLVMEQLVVRLDVAMFNAILRESEEEMPTDPISDPISDLRVLPIPGKLSFGAGAELKNAVGSWSRWLTDLFGIEDNEPPEGSDEPDSNPSKFETSFKAFHLLNALSDLMMLPFDMLADRSTRKELCPTFGAPVIKRVLSNFVPDEFNPDPVNDAVLEALDSEEHDGAGEEEVCIISVPCTAAPIAYSPPSAASLSPFIGEVGNQALQRSGTLLRKAYASDDELDELDSPLTSVAIDMSRASASQSTSDRLGKWCRKIVRYHLLREAWKESE